MFGSRLGVLCAFCSAAFFARSLAGQSTVPPPSPGTVLWKKWVDQLHPQWVPVMDRQGILWCGLQNEPHTTPIPLAIHPQTGAPLPHLIPSFSDASSRLSRSPFGMLSNGSTIGYIPHLTSWTLQSSGPTPWQAGPFSEPLSFGITHNDEVVFFQTNHFHLLKGTSGELLEKIPLPLAPSPRRSWLFNGFGPQKTVLGLVSSAPEGPWLLLLAHRNNKTFSLYRFTPTNAVPALQSASSVVTRDGLVATALSAPVAPNQNTPLIQILDVEKQIVTRTITVSDRPESTITSMIAGQDGLLYVSYTYGVKAFDPQTGRTLFKADTDLTLHSLLLGAHGILYAITAAERNPDSGSWGASLIAIASHSPQGPAISPWPRASGNNLNDFREQRVTDSDQDGLTDEEELLVYHTNPDRADSDGDGSPDGEEVRQNTDPGNGLSFPDLLRLETAFKLTWRAQTGVVYQMQSSTDLQTWTNQGPAFVGDATFRTQLLERTSTTLYFRLQPFAGSGRPSMDGTE